MQVKKTSYQIGLDNWLRIFRLPENYLLVSGGVLPLN